VNISREAALRAAWSRGLLAYKLRPYQADLHGALWKWILDENCRLGCPVISRQYGKSFVQNLVAIEVAHRVPEAQIRCVAPSRKQLLDITLPIIRQIIKDCPEDLKPKWRSKHSMWEFHNGSEMYISGANDGHADDSRGPRSHFGYIDEAGFVDDLGYLVDSVLMPQTISTGGTLVVTSTPPRSPSHPFVDIAQGCQLEGNWIHRDIYSTGFAQTAIDSYAKSCGGFESTNWKREYLALFVIDSNLAIIPEWKSEYVGLPPTPATASYWHGYEAMDLGVRDNTACLFARYDFQRAQLRVEDELILKGTSLTTPLLSDEIRKKEQALGYDKTGVYRRIADNNNLQLLQDLAAVHGLPFMPTNKDALPAMVNELRTWVGAGRIRVDPKCQNLLGCLSTGIWRNEANVGREFGRSRVYGHFDALAALMYLVRNLDVHTNPLPAGYGYDTTTQWVSPAVMERDTESAAAVRQIFRVNGRGKIDGRR
jgi:hypothetical protein